MPTVSSSIRRLPLLLALSASPAMAGTDAQTVDALVRCSLIATIFSSIAEEPQAKADWQQRERLYATSAGRLSSRQVLQARRKAVVEDYKQTLRGYIDRGMTIEQKMAEQQLELEACDALLQPREEPPALRQDEAGVAAIELSR